MTRQALVDRITSLPGIAATECDNDTLTRQLVIYLHGAPARRTIRNPRPFRLCDLGDDGIAVYGLDNWAKHQVVMRGWGKLIYDRVQLFVPRDDDELEICWNIIHQAYDSRFGATASEPATDNKSIRELPRFSRTTLQ